MRRHRLIKGIAIVCIACAVSAAASTGPVRVGVVVDGPWQGNDRVLSLFEQEIKDITVGDWDVRFPGDLRIECDWTTASVQAALEKLLADRDCDIVLAAGVIASYEAVRRGTPPKPVIAPFVINPVMQRLPSRDGASGIENLSYLTSPFSISRDVRVFTEISDFKHLAFFASQPFVDAIPDLEEYMRGQLASVGVTANLIIVGQSAEEALAAIPDGADAAFLTAMIHMPGDEHQKLIDGINARRLPSFSLFGKIDVEKGVLFGLSPSTLFPKFARRIALHFQQILLGEDAGSLQIAFSGGERLAVNMGTARAIGVFPDWRVITEAELVNEERAHVSRHWTYETVIREAYRVNQELAAAERDVAAGSHDVGRATSNLMPQVDATARGVQIDPDRADSPLSTTAERTLTGSVSVEQVIFSEPAWANRSVQQSAQAAREFDRDRTRLDVGLEAVTAYFDVLRANTLEEIQKDNVKRTRSHLELARVRREIGIAGPEEVYRWESQIATARKNVIDANARRNVAEIQLNRVLHRPLEEPFSTEDVDVGDNPILQHQQEALSYFSNPWLFKTFRNFMAREGLRLSPEMRALDARIAAAERALSSSTRAFFSPTVALSGELSHRFWEDGKGSDPVSLPDPFSNLIEEPEDTYWNFGIQMSLPIFSGGRRFVERRQDIEELAALRSRRGALAERIEQRIRSALHIAGASYAGIEQSRDAADAANRNLELVTDAYSRGVVSILDLLDAQNAAFTAEQVVADEIYDFFTNLMEVERAVGKFFFLASEAERDEWYRRLETYTREQREDR